MYIVTFFNPRVLKSIESLPREIQIRVSEWIDKLEIDPRPHGSKPLSGPLKGSWRIRVGDYRIVYDIYDQAKEVSIAQIAHRREIYRM